MGDEVSYRRGRASAHWLAGFALGLLGAAGLAATDAAVPRASGNQAMFDDEPLQIRSIDLRPGDPELYLDVLADRPVVWSSYRDQDGRLVVELPNSVPARGVEGIAPAEGLVAAIDVEREVRSSGPLTRLLIATRQAVEHAMVAQGEHLEVSLLPLGETTGKAAATPRYEPLPQQPPVTVATLDPARAAADPVPSPARRQESQDVSDVSMAGSPDSPVVAPPPAGVPATRLHAVEVSSSDGGTVVRVNGDGEFRYSYFSLDNPDRFVVDLDGVVNSSDRSTLDVGSLNLDRVRVAQFRPYPDPISRVVFDLRGTSVPRIETDGDGLVVRFGGAADSGMRMAQLDSSAAAQLPGSTPPAPAEPAPRPSLDGAPADSMEMEDDSPGAMESDGPKPGPAGDGFESEPMFDEPMEPVTDTIEVAAEPAPAADMAWDGPDPQVEEPAPRVDAAPNWQNREVSGSTSPPTGRILNREPSTEDGISFDTKTLGGDESDFFGEPIDMTMRDADVVEVLRMFSQFSGLNLVIQPGVSGTVTVELDDVPWDQALQQVLKVNNLGFELEGNIMRVAPTDVLRQEAQQRQQLEQAKALSIPLRTIIKRLSYSNAQQVAALLSSRGGVLSQRGSVIVDRRTNTLIIQELPDFIDTVIAVIENLDTPEPQVMIEARIVETTKRFTRTLGVAWEIGGESSPELGNTTGLEFPSQGSATGAVNLLTGATNGLVGLTLGNVLNSFTLEATLQAAENQGLINILSAPKIATLNNEEATIQSGLQIPIQTVANNTVTVQFVNATLELRVTPQVTAEGTILMDIEIAKREPQLAFAVQGAANAPIATKEAQTRVIVRDGGTTVIGGIYEVSTDQGEDRVPGLANIPIIGHLFRNRRRTDENEELLIFITPRVINL